MVEQQGLYNIALLVSDGDPMKINGQQRGENFCHIKVHHTTMAIRRTRLTLCCFLQVNGDLREKEESTPSHGVSFLSFWCTIFKRYKYRSLNMQSSFTYWITYACGVYF